MGTTERRDKVTMHEGERSKREYGGVMEEGEGRGRQARIDDRLKD